MVAVAVAGLGIAVFERRREWEIWGKLGKELAELTFYYSLLPGPVILPGPKYNFRNILAFNFSKINTLCLEFLHFSLFIDPSGADCQINFNFLKQKYNTILFKKQYPRFQNSKAIFKNIYNISPYFFLFL